MDENNQYILCSYDPNYEEQDYEMAWDDCITELNTWVEKYKDKWMYCWINDFGWRKASGHTTIQLKDANKLLYDVLPKTDCTFTIYADEPEGKDEYVLRIANAHHDAPTGETYYLRFLTDEELELFE